MCRFILLFLSKCVREKEVKDNMDGTVVLWVIICAASATAAHRSNSEFTKYRQWERRHRVPATASVGTTGKPHPGSTGCLVNGLVLFSGAVWFSHPCSECKCLKGAVSCRPVFCNNTAHRQRQLTQDQRHNKENMKTPKSAYKKKVSGLRVEETNYRKPGTVLKKIVPKVNANPVVIPRRPKEIVVDVRKIKTDNTLKRRGPTLKEIKKYRLEKKLFLGSDDDDDDDSNGKEDDDNDDDFPARNMAAFRPIIHPAFRTVPRATYRNGVMKYLPAGCLLSESVIACGNAGLTYWPVITDLSIKKLYLAENKIRNIPPRGLAGLPNLEWLDLSKNKLHDSSVTPDLFRNLTKLKRLNLDGNNLTKIPLLPPSLEELKINDNKISILTPYSFQGLSKLLSLDLEDNNLHDGNVSPFAFKPLQKLIYLRLEDNKFRAIPSGLPSSLQELQLSENQVEVIDEKVFNKTVHLKVLDLSHNHIREDRIAPRAWIHMLELVALDLSHNRLVHVPSFLPPALLHLSLHHNQIEFIPGYIFGHLRPGLKSLRLSHNHLADQGVHATSFQGLHNSLSELLLDHNKLQSVPHGLLQLRALERLRLDYNFIRKIPKNFICDFAQVSVHLENNLIDHRLISAMAYSCL
ncbi:extracellular matrix protein 2-like [Brienomyrus brachyistius]|uniref:extracellular matrix protein 2-like n=1 Tax=Brienomyrus brachyistius TaxID=42636 RepID=UPI0020B1B278|nr:extracellular matrix protein 2-like [Brienomyrus brachyistius]